MKIVLNEETVVFRDGSKLKVQEITYLAALKMSALEERTKLEQELEAEADPSVLTDEDALARRNFALYMYPKMAASCANGVTPTLEETMAMPVFEMTKWYEACKRVNPDLWELEPEEEPTPEETEEVKKKVAGTHRHRKSPGAASS